MSPASPLTSAYTCHTVANVRVVTDSCSDLPRALVDRYGMAVVPLTVRFGDEEFLDGRDLTPDEFWERCAGSPILPETSAASPGMFEEVFRSSAGYDGVVCVTISSTFSATWQSAHTAAKSVADVLPVRVVDSRSTSLGEGMVALRAARRAAEGAPIDEVAAAAQAASDQAKLVVAVDTLDNLKKGGRIGGAEALAASILSITPVIVVRDGVVGPGAKQRTRARALRYLVETAVAESDVSEVGVMHAAARDLDDLLGLLSKHFPQERIVIGEIGAAIGTHVGAGAIGVTYQLR